MPELPEVHTTATILNKLVKGLIIKDVWTDYESSYHADKNNIKNPNYFKQFKKEILGKKISAVYRRGKNVLFDLSGGITALAHMKMTGHFLYGTYRKISNSPNYLISNKIPNHKSQTKEKQGEWEAVEPETLKDPFNSFIHLVFTFSNGKHLAFSDMRKFAKVIYFETARKDLLSDLSQLGPEPLAENFSLKIFRERLCSRPNEKVKQVLLDQEVISGIGNIYSDEILWGAEIHPLSLVKNIPGKVLHKIFNSTKKLLKAGIKAGGDSMSDFRNPYGEKGNFQNFHKAYRRAGENCPKRGCGGKIKRIVIATRSAHYCDKHQQLFK